MIFIHSIRGRLLLWLASLLTLVLLGFGITAYQLQSVTRMSAMDGRLERRLTALNADAAEQGPPGGHRPGGGPPKGPPPSFRDRGPGNGPGDGPPPPPDDSQSPNGSPEDPRHRAIRLSDTTQAMFNEADPNGYYFEYWSRDGDLLRRSTNAPESLSSSVPTDGDKNFSTHTRGDYREVHRFNDSGECALVGRTVRGDLDALRQFAFWLVMAGGSVLALGLGGGWWFINRALHPVEKISAAAEKISSGDLAQRISVIETESELGKLAGVLNATFARLETAFSQQKQFTADAAHELRTPIAVLISEAQTTLARERNASEYRDAVANCLETAQQMRRLTDSLLELARLDAGQEPLYREKINLAAVAQDGVKLIRPLAAARKLEIHCDLAVAETSADADKLGQVVTNLLTNAVRYNREGGEILVTTRVDKDFAVLAIADTGQGITTEDLPRVFERFYRADKSRSTRGSGLGLSICQAIVQAHGGAIEVASVTGSGTTFSVRLPVWNAAAVTAETSLPPRRQSADPDA